jgi:hypothetical protein
MPARVCLMLLFATCAGAALAQAKGNPALPCYQALAGDPRFAPVKDKVALGGTMDEMRRMTARGDRASPQEGEALAAWKSARDACHQQELPYYATRDLEIQALAREHFEAVQRLIAELQVGEMNYGEFGKRRLALYEKVNRDIEKVRRNILPAKPAPHTVDKK